MKSLSHLKKFLFIPSLQFEYMYEVRVLYQNNE